MSSPKRPARAIDNPAPKLRKWGSCGQLGHDRKTCSVVLPEVAVDGAYILRQGSDGKNVVDIPDPPPPLVQAPVVQASLMDWEKVIYVVFDLETTGRSRQQDKVIELAAVVLDWTGVEIEEAFFLSLSSGYDKYHPTLPPLRPLQTTWLALLNHFLLLPETFSEIILVGHNAKVFDIPWQMHQLTVHGIINNLLGNGRINYGMDTLGIAKTAIKNNQKSGSPSAYNLPTLFQFVSRRLPDTSHRAMADVKGTATIFRFFWETREECYFFIAERGESNCPPALQTTCAFANDSDDSDSESDSVQDKVVGTGTILSDNEEETGEESEQARPVDDEPTNNDPQGDRWEQDCDYLPLEPLQTPDGAVR
jgi:DNA polymerase III epsilon subunit-like protein